MAFPAGRACVEMHFFQTETMPGDALHATLECAA
jgi:hypothetical protein